MTDTYNSTRHRRTLLAVSVALVLYGIVGFPTPADPGPQAAAHPPSGEVRCSIVGEFMGTPVEKCRYVSIVGFHHHNTGNPYTGAATTIPGTATIDPGTTTIPAVPAAVMTRAAVPTRSPSLALEVDAGSYSVTP